MTTYVVQGFYGSQILIAGGGSTLVAGSHFMIDPNWDLSTSVRTFTFTDDDANLSGDSNFLADEIGNDATQSVVVQDASGATLYSGRVYAEWSATFTAPDGSTVEMYTLEIGGTIIGQVASAPLQPGVTYQVSAVPDVTTGPTYTSLASMTFDPDLVNVIQGGQYNDSLLGGAGDDTISAGAGADTIDGGTGNDSISFGTGGDLVHGGDGNDMIDDYAGSTGYVWNDTLYGDAGNDTIWAGAGNDYVDGGADNDLIYGEDGNDTLYGGTGADTIYGGAGNDQIHGGDGNDLLYGEAGSNTIWGDAGADTIDGGTGNDVLYGGADADVFTFHDGFGSDTVWGDSLVGTTSDTDTLDFSALSSAVTVTFTGSEDGTAANGLNTVTFDNIEAVVGTALDDRIDASLDTSGLSLSGGAGNDTITGGSGADTVEGGDGNDSILGGAGNDSIDGGTGADMIDGGTGNDSILGGDGNDTLIGNAGSDTLVGGTGNDSISGGADADVIRIAEGDGTDTVLGGETGSDYDYLQFTGNGVHVTMTGPESGSWTMTGSTGTFTEIEDVTGTAGNDTLDASGVTTGGVHLSGGAGADQVIGGTGADGLWGGDGNDTLTGGAGDDTLNGDAGNDLLQGGTGNDMLLTGAGNDTALGGDGNDYISDLDGADYLAGEAGDDTIYGGSLNDTIVGGAGSDSLSGGTGSDLFVFGDDDGADRITDFDMTLNSGLTTDQLDVSDLHDGDGNPVNAWDVTVGNDGSGNAVLTFPGGESLTLVGVSPSQLATAPQLHSIGIPCLVAGTPVATPRGPVPVEALRRGDLVCIRDGPPQPVLWAGARWVSAAQMRADPRLLPVEIRAGALGNAQALRLSALHALLVPEGRDGALARAGHLAGTGWGGARVLRGWVRHDEGVSYHHLLLPHHALIAAGGLWVESFWPGREALVALEVTQRHALIRACPALARVIWGGESAETAYGPPARRFLRRCQIDHAACAKWSLGRCGVTLSDGFATEGKADGTALKRRRIEG